MNADALEHAVTEVTASMAFADAIPTDQRPPADAWRFVIPLHAPTSAQLLLEVGPGDADALARIAWGAFLPDRPEAVHEFVHELLNVIAGRYLALAWPDADPRIGFAAPLADPWPAAPRFDRVYDVGGAPVRIALA